MAHAILSIARRKHLAAVFTTKHSSSSPLSSNTTPSLQLRLPHHLYIATNNLSRVNHTPLLRATCSSRSLPSINARSNFGWHSFGQRMSRVNHTPVLRETCTQFFLLYIIRVSIFINK